MNPMKTEKRFQPSSSKSRLCSQALAAPLLCSMRSLCSTTVVLMLSACGGANDPADGLSGPTTATQQNKQSTAVQLADAGAAAADNAAEQASNADSGSASTGIAQALAAPARTAPTPIVRAPTGPLPVPIVERLELVASDGLGAVEPLSNQWGLHQPRITVHNDGTIRLIYLKRVDGSQLQWILMQRSVRSGLWSKESQGYSTEDVTLQRDPRTDLAHAVVWPSGVPVVRTYPGVRSAVIPGSWEMLHSSSRHYGNTGIGADGTLCLKASREQASAIPTSTTDLQITCGRQDAITGNWGWSTPMKAQMGLRRAYDHLYPGGLDGATQLLGTSQIDAHKAALGLNSLPASQGNYVFNGITGYQIGAAGASWRLSETVRGLATPANSAIAPLLRQQDSYVDRNQLLNISYVVKNPTSPQADGIYLQMLDAKNNAIASGKISALPDYGYTRLFDDEKGRKWLLWTNRGSQATQVLLYPIRRIGSNFVMGQAFDLSRSFAPYAIEGAPLLAVPRGGQVIGSTVAGMMLACEGTYSAGKLAACYPGSTSRQKIIYFQVRLPS